MKHRLVGKEAVAVGIIETQLQALQHGFRLVDLERDGALLWGWRRGAQQMGPWFSTEREAAAWMAEQLENTEAIRRLSRP